MYPRRSLSPVVSAARPAARSAPARLAARAALAALAAALLLAACGPALDARPPSDRAPTSAGAEADTAGASGVAGTSGVDASGVAGTSGAGGASRPAPSDPSDPSDPAGPGGASVDAAAAGGPSAPLPPCLPAAREWREDWPAPVVAPGCAGEAGGASVDVTRESRLGVEVTRHVFGPDGTPREVTVQPAEGARSWRTPKRWRFDDAGRLVEYVAGAAGRAPELRVEQTWRDGRLVARTVESADAGAWRDAWSYDGAGRLVYASRVGTAVSGEPAREVTATATFTYDAGGRPATVDRELDGVSVARQRWQWNDDGALVAREFEASEGVGYRPGLDTFEPFGLWMSSSAQAFQADPWPDAAPRPAAGATCAPVPTSVGHGYPASEGLYYALGFAVDARPHGIGFAYRYNGYGWNYGDLAWYGHAGAGTLWPGAWYGQDGVAVGRIAYDAHGRMVVEDAALPGLVLHRARRFAAEGGLERDELRVEPEGRAPFTRTLAFEHGAASRVTRRTLLHDGEVAEQQTWEHAPTGGVTSHVVWTQATARAWDLGAEELTRPLGTPLLGARYMREYDAAGRETARGEAHAWDDSGLVEAAVPMTERSRYDADGRLVEVSGGPWSGAEQQRRELRYDEAGRLVFDASDADGDGRFERATVFTYDADGALETRRETWDGDVTGELERRAARCGR